MTRSTLIKLALLAVTAVGLSAETILVSGSDSNLYSLNPTTGALTLVGAMGVEMFDIAMTPGGALYGVSSFTGSTTSSLYSISTSTGAATLLGNTGVNLNAFDIGLDGTAYAAGGPTGNTFYTLNLGTHAASAVGTGTYISAGDLEFIGNTLYLSGLAPDQLYTINTGTGAGTPTSSAIGFTNVYGLAYLASTSTFYGIANPTATSAEVITLDQSTGAGSGPVAITLGGTAVAFNITGAAVADTPEPATFGIVALGLAGVFRLVSKRRKLSA